MRKLELLTALLAATAASGIAQGPPVAGQAPGGDPPSRVARLNFEQGPVSFRPGSVEDWTAASLNYPLTSGDHLWADARARAEMHVGSTAIRMDSLTALSLLNLDDHMVQISLTQGAIDVHIRYLGENDTYEVDTPNVAVSLLRTGDYRINADGDNNVTVVAVRGGEAEVTAGGAAFPVHPGQSARLMGTDTVSQELAAVPPPDEFDGFCGGRDRREDQAVQSVRYVPREMIGYEDLDANGVWREVPPYGMVWTPRTVAVGWAPYQTGHWAWVDPWGWTWIDDAPWGFAPFHYGRWANAGGAWVWIPGVVTARPVYSPALVAFVGGPGFGLSVGVGGGGVAAWFPLGPGEVYRPAYHVSEIYVRNVNVAYVSNVTVIGNVNAVNVRYANQTVAGAVTVVPHAVFVGARPVAAAVVVMPQREIFAARVVGYTAPIAPTRVSVVASVGVGVAVHAPPERFAARVVVARTPPPPPPVSFAAREEMLRANQGRPLEPAQVNAIRAAAPQPRPMVRTAPVRFGSAGGTQAAPVRQQPEMSRPQPEVARPPQPAIRNDRPPTAQPARIAEPQRVVEPQRNVEQPHSAEHPATNQPQKKTPPKKGEKTEKNEERKDR